MKSTLISICILLSIAIHAQTVSGELKRWHKVTLSFTGPNTSESANPNPFTDYRLDVTFTNGSSSYTVPGYYAGCANAQDSGCNSGATWKVHFAPGKTGTWNWTASFKSGDDIAIKSGGSSAGFMDGDSGFFDIAESDKSGRDHRAKDKGMLQYVGEHYLRYSGTDPENPNGNWFVKAGADSPENALNYVDFDATPNYTNTLNKIGSKSWQPHQQDYDANDASAYTWDNGKGTEILGMINYLSGQGANVLSFLTWNTSGDGGAVFPHTLKVSLNEYGNTGQGQQWNKVNKDRFDVSKLAQWEKMMEYADKKGMYLHLKTMETENDNLMDGDNFGRERKLYYRELIARFSHHLALNWNLTEETTLKDAVVRSTASYIKDLDPYDHNIVLHTYPPQKEQRYTPLLGDKSQLTGASLQIDKKNVHKEVKEWVDKSRNAGKKWIVANDEQGGAGEGVRVSDKRIRDEVLWGTLMAGGAGVEYYSGYTDDDGDINGNDHRKRGNKYKQGGYALRFFNDHLQPYMVEMVSADGITSDNNDYVFAKAGEVYAVYRPNGGSTGINLPSGTWQVQWYNPRSGGSLSAPQAITNSLTAPDTNDWVALIKGNSTGGPDPACADAAAFPTEDAYIEGTTKKNTDELRVEQGNRTVYMKFTIPAIDEEVSSIVLEMTVNSDPGEGTIEVYKGNSTNWTEDNLSNTNKPSEGAKIGSVNGNFNAEQTYRWVLSDVVEGEEVTLILKHQGSNDVGFHASEGSRKPRILVVKKCESTGTGNCTDFSMKATTDFTNLNVSGFSPAYKDTDRDALAIDAALYKDEFAAAASTFTGETNSYNVTLNTLRELDGESSYRVVINDQLIGEFQNPTTDIDYATASVVFENIAITKGAIVRVEFNSNTNGKIPEGNSTAFSRGRWTSLVFSCAGGVAPPPLPNPTNCDHDFEEKNGLAVIEVERLDISGTDWQLSTAKPGFSGDNYIEWNGSDNFNTPGFGIISARIKINTPGKYRFQWRSRVGEGTNATEANDSWLKILGADDFFGESNGNKVYPKGIGKTPIAEGASADGWIKVYLNGTTEWTWRSATNDNDPHQIYAEFDNAGVYTIQISGRSKHHLIDRIVMYNSGVTEANATNLNQSETLGDCELSVNPFDAIKQQLFITPNPAQNQITLHGLKIKAKASIYNILGRKVRANISFGANAIKTITIDSLPAGMYFLTLQDDENNAISMKFVKN